MFGPGIVAHLASQFVRGIGTPAMTDEDLCSKDPAPIDNAQVQRRVGSGASAYHGQVD